MRLLERNKQVFYYTNFVGSEEIIDEYGNATGQYEIKQSKPVKYRAHISGNKGEAMYQGFGADVEYDRIIILSNKNVPIDEHSMLWVDIDPVLNGVGEATSPPNYIVSMVSPTLNYKAVAIKRVETSWT